jgi:hypothetical protein
MIVAVKYSHVELKLCFGEKETDGEIWKESEMMFDDGW